MVKYLTILAVAMSVVQLFYWVYFFRGLMRHKTHNANQNDLPPLSIIICIKNELANIKKNLESTVAQEYESLQIIIADDFSSDESQKFLDLLKEKWIDKEKKEFLIHEVKQNKQGKKQALKEAIGLAQYPWLLLTDADCRPKGNKWANSMINAAHTPQIDIVLGYSPIKATHSLVSQWAHYEACLLYTSPSPRDS